MIEAIKNIFTGRKKKEHTSDSPGRTFKRILTGRCFGCEDKTEDTGKVAQAKQRKIDQIRELKLKPMYIKYTYHKTKNDTQDKKIISAHVAFQKEVLAKKWNMIHITEISFTVDHNDFDEFEQMSGVNLSKDFRDITSDNISSYQREERRKEQRASYYPPTE